MSRADDRRGRFEAGRLATRYGFHDTARQIFTRLARELVADPTTPPESRAELEALLNHR